MKSVKSYINLFGFLLILIMASACKGDDEEIPQNRAPVITEQSFSVAEDINDEAIIGVVEASDADEDALSFSITETVAANSNRDFTGLFEIDETTGALSLADDESLDYEDASGFSVTISVSDTELTATASITITVTDVEEVDRSTAFLTTWRTTTANQAIGFGTIDSLTYNYNVDWGDGTIETNLTGSPTHTYASPGDYQVAITGNFPAILSNGASQLISIDQWGNIVWETMSFAFADMYEFEENASDAPDLSRVTDMSSMFYRSVFLTGDFNNWDVSNVTDMSEMFHLVVISTVNITDWDVSNVTDMSRMFSSTSGLRANISSWDVSNVTNMSGMFAAGDIHGDISGWDVSNVTDMSGMFANSHVSNADFTSWDVSNVTDMGSMFAFARSFNGELGSWDVSNVTNMSGMFRLAGVFNGDISNWDVSNVTDMDRMFNGAFRFNQDIGGWNVGNVTNMSQMFLMDFDVYIRNDPSDFNQNIGDWDVSNVTDMSEMFSGALRFNQDISNWDVGNVTNMMGMFAVPLDPNKADDPPDFNQDIGSWDVSNVIDMSTMFRLASNFNQDLTRWDVMEVIRCSGFSESSSLATDQLPDFTNCDPNGG